MKNIKVQLLFTVLLIVTLSCSVENDLSKTELKGKVKSVKEISYSAIKKFGKLTKDVKKRENNKEYDTYKEYNIEGNIILEQKYYSSGSMRDQNSFKYKGMLKLGFDTEFYNGDKILNFKSIFKYDDKRNIIEESNYYDIDESPVKKTTYKYDDKGNQVEMAIYSEDGNLNLKDISKYDNKGNKVEFNSYSGNGDLRFKSIYEYDDQGNEVEWISYNEDGKLEFKYIYEYDDNGNQVKYMRYNENDKLNFIAIYKYDDNGNVVEKSLKINAIAEPFSIESYTYEYDNKNNWIKKTIEKTESFDFYIIEREIEYFN